MGEPTKPRPCGAESLQGDICNREAGHRGMHQEITPNHVTGWGTPDMLRYFDEPAADSLPDRPPGAPSSARGETPLENEND